MKWQARRDSNPQHPDLESGALSIRATGLLSSFWLLCLPVQLVPTAKLAVLLDFQAVLHRALVFGCRVIALLTFRTG